MELALPGLRRKRRTMRRRLVLSIAVLGVVSLAGAACGKSTTTTPGSTNASGTPSPTFTTLKQGTLQVASCLDYAPFETVENGKPKGFDVELAEEIARRLGLQVQWIKTDFDASFTALAGNQFDAIAAAITATGKLGQDRAQIVDFSDLYFNSRQSLSVNTAKTPDVTTTSQLPKGAEVGVQKGTTGKDWAETNLKPNGIAIKTYTAAPDAFRDLEAGNIAGVINDAPSSDAIVKDLSNVKVVQYIDTNEKYAFAFSKDNFQLKAAWNDVMKQVFQDGTYKRIFEKWFPGATVPPEFSGG
jgi:ABC-type amino acid transport substrate-binding protein